MYSCCWNKKTIYIPVYCVASFKYSFKGLNSISWSTYCVHTRIQVMPLLLKMLLLCSNRTYVGLIVNDWHYKVSVCQLNVHNYVQHASADVERILIGNKCDWEARRVVSKERGAALAHNQSIPFLETSAKTNYNVEEVFETLAKQILKKVSCLVLYVWVSNPSLQLFTIIIIVEWFWVLLPLLVFWRESMLSLFFCTNAYTFIKTQNTVCGCIIMHYLVYVHGTFY